MMKQFFLSLLLLYTIFATPGQMPGFMNNSMPNMGAMNASEIAELEALEKELARAAQEIDQYVASLSPEEQEQFHQAVKEVESMLENMSEDEFNQMLNQMFQEPEQASLTQPDILTPPKIADQVIAKPTLSLEESRKQETALQLIENLTRYTNSFIVKTQSVPEMPGSIDRWALQGKIAHWPAATTWSLFEKQIEVLNQRFYLLLDKDESKNQFRYLLDLIADEKTFSYLFELEKKLAQYEPLIETPTFGSAKMNTVTKNALKNVVSAYSAALYAQDVIKAIETIIEKYGPIAKKLKDEETQRAERAKQEAGKPSQMGRTAIAGRPSEPDSGNFGASTDFGGGYPGGYNPGYYGGSDYYPSYGGGYGSEQKNPQESSPSSGGSRSKKDSGDSKPSSSKKSSDDKKDTTKDDTKEKVSIDRLIGQIEESFESIKTLFDEYPLFTSISKHCTSSDPVDATLAGFAISSLDQRISAATNQIKNFDKKLAPLKKEVRDAYKAEVNKAFKKNRASLEKCKQDLLSLQDNWKTVQKTIAPDKLKAYFNESDLTTAIAKDGKSEVTAQNKQDKLETNNSGIKPTTVDFYNTDEYKTQYALYKAEKERLENQRNNLPKGASSADLDKQLQTLAQNYFGTATEPLPPVDDAVQITASRPSNPDLPFNTVDSTEEVADLSKLTSSSTKETPGAGNTIQSVKSLFDVLDSINGLYTALNKLNVG